MCRALELAVMDFPQVPHHMRRPDMAGKSAELEGSSTEREPEEVGEEEVPARRQRSTAISTMKAMKVWAPWREMVRAARGTMHSVA